MNIKKTKKMEELLKKGTSFALAAMTAFTLTTTPVKAVESNPTQIKTLSYANIAVYKGVNIVINDMPFTPTDVNGKEVPPFIYNGTTYLPARAISNAFNAQISWDGATNSVYIDTTNVTGDAVNNTMPRESTTPFLTNIKVQEGVNLYIDNELYIPTNAKGEPVDIFLVDGTTYLPVRALANIFDTYVEWEDETNTVYLGKHIMTPPTTNEGWEKLFNKWQGYINDLEPYQDVLDERLDAINEATRPIYKRMDEIESRMPEHDRLWDLPKEMENAYKDYSNANYEFWKMMTDLDKLRISNHQRLLDNCIRDFKAGFKDDDAKRYAVYTYQSIKEIWECKDAYVKNASDENIAKIVEDVMEKVDILEAVVDGKVYKKEK